MIKLLDIKPLGGERFAVSFSQNGVEQQQNIIYRQDLWIESLGEAMPYIIPEDTDFFDVWGQDLEFRKEIFNRIRAIRENSDKFPQAA